MKPRLQGERKRELIHSAKTIAPRILRLSLPHRRTLVFGFIALALGSGINLFFPYFIKRVLNGDLGLRFPDDLIWVTALLIALFAVQAVVFAVRHFCFTAVGYRVVAGLRKDLFRALLHQDVSYFDSARTGDLMSRLSSDSQLLQNAVAINLSVATRYALQVIGGTALMFWISAKLASLLLLLLPVFFVTGKVWGKKLQRLSKAMQSELGESAVVAEESLNAIRTVRVFAGEEFEEGRFNRAVQGSLSSGEGRARVAAVFSSTMVFILHSSIAAMFFYGTQLVLRAELSAGDLTAFILYGVIVAVSFGFLLNVFDEFMHAVGAGERIFQVLDSKPAITSPTPGSTVSSQVEVEFRSVTFSYPSRCEVPVLKGVSLTIGEGQTTAIVGPSGAGKSTVSLLIPRFYDPSAGQVLFGGTDVRELNLRSLREQIAVVSQDSHLFSATLAENIRYGKRDATDDELKRAAAAAQLAEFVASQPEGFNTVVGSRGVQLSGGQRQRVAIARAILRDPKFLILDEATSALDSENEHLIQEALTSLMQGRTTLIIAHRLSTVQHAHQVLVMQEGQIVQRGTHQTLIDQPGLYRTLVEHQML